MANFTIGSWMGVPCRVHDGPFEDEMLVEIDSLEGTISGFTSRRNVIEGKGQPLLKGRVEAVEDDVVTLWLEGSFFSTNGLAHFTSNSAGTRLMPLAA